MRKHNEHGNALFLILIAVALFAALSYAVTQSGRGGGNVDRETLLIETAQLVQYISSITQAVQRLQLINGCSDTQISLLYDSDGDGTAETNGDDAFFNPNAPADGSCNVFSPNGGAITYIQPSDTLRDTTELTGANLFRSGDIVFAVDNEYFQVGTDGIAGQSTDLSLIIPYMNADACAQINQSLGIEGNTQDTNISIPASITDPAAFVGVYPATPVGIVGDEAIGSALVGQATACVDETLSSTAGLHFYQILIER